MKILTYITGPLKVNTYIIINEDTREAVAIDVGGDEKYLEIEEKRLDFRIKAILLTHAHIDHIGGVEFFKKRGEKVYISKEEEPFLHDREGNLTSYFYENFMEFDADYTFKDNDIVTICGFSFKALLTPGHTKGSSCFILDDLLFSGDTLFNGNFGRSDFKSGDFGTLKNSIINIIFKLDKDYKVLPGHGEFTTLAKEKKNNDILKYV